MVRTYKRKSEWGSYGQGTLKNALLQVQNGMPLIRASKEFGVPPRKLRRHRDRVVKEPGTLKLGLFHNALTAEVEQQLKTHIVELEKKMFGLSYRDVRKLIFDLASHPFNKTAQLAGKDWVQRFLYRHDLALRQPQGTSNSMASGFNRGQVNRFFELYKEMLEANDFPPSRIWNADETGVTTVKNLQKIITKKGSRSVGKITSAEGSHFTMLCACNAAGTFLPPMYIFRRKRMTEALMVGAPQQSVGYPSNSGWIDQDLFLKWLEHFTKFSNPTTENPHIIIIDGHHSHKTLAAVDYCRSKGIHLLTLPPHSTPKMQPLDRTYFKSFKAAFNSTTDHFMVSHPGRRITVYDMAQLTGTAFLRTALTEKAVNGFKSCGLWPFDPNIFTDEDFDAVLDFGTQKDTDTHITTGRCSNMSTAVNGNTVPSTTNSAEADALYDKELQDGTPAQIITTDPCQIPLNDKNQLSSSETDQPLESNEFKLIPTLGDGRCLFRSLAIGMNEKLQVGQRDEDGKLDDPLLEVIERGTADELRSKVISFMCEGIERFDYIQGDAVNADLPTHIRYASLKDRIIGMADPLSMPGEIEILNTSKVVKRPIYVLGTNRSAISKYGMNDGFVSAPLYVQYSRIGEDVGHYDCLLKTNSEIERNGFDSDITEMIHALSPPPVLKRSGQKKRTRKPESSAVLTSSPYKRVLEMKETKGKKKKKSAYKRQKGKPVKKASKKNVDSSDEEDWPCLICCDPYTNTRPGEVWVECQVCKKWAHEECTQGLLQFICPNCESDVSE